MITAIEAWTGVYRIHAPWEHSKTLNPWIKEGDGERKRYHFDYNGIYGKKAWYIPAVRLEALSAQAAKWGIEFKTLPKKAAPESTLPLAGDLTAWQRRGVTRLLRDRVMLAQWATGTGKSRLALETFRVLPPGTKALVVCPKVVMKTWEDEQIPKWLPEDTHAWALIAGRKLDRPQPEITLVSWGSLHKIPAKWKFDFIVFDEIHAGIHGQSKRTKLATYLRIRNPTAIVLGLTGTPVSADLTNLWGQLNILMPHAWGTYRRWWESFFEKLPVGYEDHVKPGPLLQSTLPQLIDELDTICDYVSVEDAGDALPEIKWNRLEIGEGAAPGRLTPPENLSQWRQEQLATGKLRAAAFCAKAPNPLPGPTAIITYHRDLANEVTKGLKDLSPVMVSGDVPPNKRHELLADANIAIITMRSVTEGLDLRRYTNIYVLEAYPVPIYLTQVLGRFIRLFATEPVNVSFCRLQGSTDDLIVNRLMNRLSDQGKLLQQGKTEKGLQALLSLDENSEDFLASLRAACENIEDADFGEEWDCEGDGDDNW